MKAFIVIKKLFIFTTFCKFSLDLTFPNSMKPFFSVKKFNAALCAGVSESNRQFHRDMDIQMTEHDRKISI